jgi:U3 small nucleolar ribonucleoprotein component
MYKVNVKNTCSCFLKSGMADTQEFKSKDEAKNEAEFMLKTMQEKFCKKHEFVINEQFGDYTIFIKPRS